MITRYGGVGYCGQLGAGNISVDGEVRDFALEAGPLTTVRGSFRFDHPNGAENHRFIIYHNRKPMCFATPDSGFQTAPLPVGEHEFDVLRVRATSRGIPEIYGELCNRRPYLRWSASPDSDCRGYKIFWDSGTGTVDYDEPYSLVSATEIQQLRDAAADLADDLGPGSVAALEDESRIARLDKQLAATGFRSLRSDGASGVELDQQLDGAIGGLRAGDRPRLAQGHFGGKAPAQRAGDEDPVEVDRPAGVAVEVPQQPVGVGGLMSPRADQGGERVDVVVGQGLHRGCFVLDPGTAGQTRPAV